MSETIRPDEPRKLFTGRIGRALFLARHARGEGWGQRIDQAVPTKFGLFWYRSADGRGPVLIVGQFQFGLMLMYPERIDGSLDGELRGYGWPE